MAECLVHFAAQFPKTDPVVVAFRHGARPREMELNTLIIKGIPPFPNNVVQYPG